MKIMVRYNPQSQWGITFGENYGYGRSYITIYWGEKKVFITRQ